MFGCACFVFKLLSCCVVSYSRYVALSTCRFGTRIYRVRSCWYMCLSLSLVFFFVGVAIETAGVSSSPASSQLVIEASAFPLLLLGVAVETAAVSYPRKRPVSHEGIDISPY